MYTSQSALKFSMTERNHETQFKIHIQPFPSITNQKSLKSVKGCTRLDYLTNNSIHSNLKIHNINHKVIDYQNKQKEHIEQMDRDRLPKILLEYKPGGYRKYGRP